MKSDITKIANRSSSKYSAEDRNWTCLDLWCLHFTILQDGFFFANCFFHHDDEC